MKQGTVEEIVLTRSVTKHIRKHNKNLLIGAGVGNDYSSVATNGGNVISCESVSGNAKLAWIKAMNNFATSGGSVIGVRVILMLSKTDEEADVKRYMSEINALADENAVQILGGHTQVTENQETYFCIFVLGIAGKYQADLKNIKPNYDIVMTKYAGIYGNDYLIEQYRAELDSRFAKSYINSASFGDAWYSVNREAGIAAEDTSVYYMHDVSKGGVYGALWQLGSRINKGIVVNNCDIQIKQETIEFCELFDLNPYMLEGTGSLLIVSSNGTGLVDKLMAEGINAAVVGKVSDNKEKCVDTGSEKRFLQPVKGDEIYRKQVVI